MGRTFVNQKVETGETIGSKCKNRREGEKILVSREALVYVWLLQLFFVVIIVVVDFTPGFLSVGPSAF